MRKLAISVIICGMVLLVGQAAFALPFLQLDIADGSYNKATETVTASAEKFTLYALTDPTKGTSLGTDFFLSIALVPKAGTANVDFGSFVFNGTTIDSMSEYGMPTELSKHGIFETAYMEKTFQFNSTDRATAYDAGTVAGAGTFTADPNGSLYYKAFTFDVGQLAEGYSLHFDLYDGAGNFAPYSHDAQSTVGDGGSNVPTVPEPATLLLLGLGLLGLAGLKKRIGTK